MCRYQILLKLCGSKYKISHCFNKSANISRHINLFQGVVQLLLSGAMATLKKDFKGKYLSTLVVLDIKLKSEARFQIFVLHFTDSFSFPYFVLTFHVFLKWSENLDIGCCPNYPGCSINAIKRDYLCKMMCMFCINNHVEEHEK